MTGWKCDKCYGRPIVTTDKAAHHFISHVTKIAALQCRLCDHQDVVEADFVDHAFVYHAFRFVLFKHLLVISSNLFVVRCVRLVLRCFVHVLLCVAVCSDS